MFPRNQWQNQLVADIMTLKVILCFYDHLRHTSQKSFTHSKDKDQKWHSYPRILSQIFSRSLATNTLVQCNSLFLISLFLVKHNIPKRLQRTAWEKFHHKENAMASPHRSMERRITHCIVKLFFEWDGARLNRACLGRSLFGGTKYFPSRLPPCQGWK